MLLFLSMEAHLQITTVLKIVTFGKPWEREGIFHFRDNENSSSLSNFEYKYLLSMPYLVSIFIYLWIVGSSKGVPSSPAVWLLFLQEAENQSESGSTFSNRHKKAQVFVNCSSLDQMQRVAWMMKDLNGGLGRELKTMWLCRCWLHERWTNSSISTNCCNFFKSFDICLFSSLFFHDAVKSQFLKMVPLRSVQSCLFSSWPHPTSNYISV